MKICKTCHLLIIGDEARQAFSKLEEVMEFHGFVPKTIHEVAVSVGPMCEKCLKKWSNDLTAA